MLKVLIVSYEWPFPEHRNGVAKILANLLVKNKYYKAELFYIGKRCGLSKQEVDVRRVLALPKSRSLDKFLKCTFFFVPYCAYDMKKSSNRIAEELRCLHNEYDLIHLIGPALSVLANFADESFFRKIILTSIDSMSLHFYRRQANHRFGFWRSIYWIEKTKLLVWEKKYYSKFEKITFVAEADMEWVSSRLGRCAGVDFSFIPNGVDTDYFVPVELDLVPRKPMLIFTGNMDYYPNEDAAHYLIDEIIPLVQQKFDVDLCIVGSNPSKQLLLKRSNSTCVTGFVPDIRRYVNAAACYVSPLRYGSGIKNKILEAMAMGKIVVGSDISFEGIRATNLKNCIVSSNEAVSFANAICSVLGNISEHLNVGTSARELVTNNYSWCDIREKYFLLYRKKINRQHHD